MRPDLRTLTFAAVLSVIAAFLWSTYYLFVLKVTPGTGASAILTYPFAFGGVAYAAWAVRHGHGRALVTLFRRPAAYLRIGLLLAMQTSVLAATLLTGPVDAALLSLLGDVVATPLLVAWMVVEARPQLGSWAFVAGLALSLGGGTLAIAGGRTVETVPLLGWVAVIAVPISVAFFFVLSARAGGDVPLSAVVAQSMLVAALASAALAPLVPGGVLALVTIGPGPLALLAVNGVVSFFLAPALYFRAIEQAGLVVPPMMMTGIPVFTLLLSAGVLGIAPPFLGLLGVPIAVVGGLVALRAGAR